MNETELSVTPEIDTPVQLPVRDKYTDAIEEIVNAEDPAEAANGKWFYSKAPFQFCTPSGYPEPNANGKSCGCLTMVHRIGFNRYAFTESLTKAIQADANIHDTREELADALRNAESKGEMRGILSHYANWQRRMDLEFRS